mmetsp:Transcript_13584/g.39606  ORF Transcript_13584/g.39606 Transcript_13584/m.39606 type:complete len:554 (-) Transcript_13584:193-1854(-)
MSRTSTATATAFHRRTNRRLPTAGVAKVAATALLGAAAAILATPCEASPLHVSTAENAVHNAAGVNDAAAVEGGIRSASASASAPGARAQSSRRKKRTLQLGRGSESGTNSHFAELDILRQEYDPNDGGDLTLGGDGASSFPALSDLVSSEWEVIGDVSWMLDFAIVGNAKCGTTFLAHYINYGSDQARMPHYEVCKLSHQDPESIGEFVELLYDELLEEGEEKLFKKAEKDLEEQDQEEEEELEEEEEEEEHQYDEGEYDEDEELELDGELSTLESQEIARRHGRRDQNGNTRHGLKCPKELGTEPSLRNYAQYFPSTDFLVTVRHPVLWFQSFYNYRFASARTGPPPTPDELIGPCTDDGPYLCGKRCGKTTDKKNVCTDRANFHHQLARFGKTPMEDPEELRLLRHNSMSVQPVRGKIFLLELGQVFAGTESSRTLPGDLADFLRLERDLPEIEKRHHHHPELDNPEEYARTHKYKINICEEKYMHIREVLVEIGTEASEWIKKYFLQSGDVVVTSQHELERLLDEWSKDPCDDEVEMGRRLALESQYDY